MPLQVNFDAHIPSNGLNTGNNVTGSAKIINTAQIKLQYIKLSLVGSTTTMINVPKGKNGERTKKIEEEHVFYKNSTLLMPKDGSKVSLLDIGEHSFQFDFNLPKAAPCYSCHNQITLPPSLMIPSCNVSYKLVLDIKLPTLIHATKSYSHPLNIMASETPDVIKRSKRLDYVRTPVTIKIPYEAQVERPQSYLSSLIFGEKKPRVPPKNTLDILVWLEARSLGFVQRRGKSLALTLHVLSEEKYIMHEGSCILWVNEVEVKLRATTMIAVKGRNETTSREHCIWRLTKPKKADLKNTITSKGLSKSGSPMYEIDMNITDEKDLLSHTIDVPSPSIQSCNLSLDYAYQVDMNFSAELKCSRVSTTSTLNFPVVVTDGSTSGECSSHMSSVTAASLPSYAEATSHTNNTA